MTPVGEPDGAPDFAAFDALVQATRMMGRFVDAFARLPEVPRVP